MKSKCRRKAAQRKELTRPNVRCTPPGRGHLAIEKVLGMEK